ncbi:hypothetical protein ACO2Q8_23395 [Larkinella sp. VNQ87]|uniref:hypothetical protein n=1 Tax=Larkinella sp. VNQ87 TaxID=3400921 RepID=UPI003C0AF8B5
MQKVFRSTLFFSLLLVLTATQSLHAQNRLKKIAYSDGSVRQFFYDAKGKLTKEELTRNQTPLSQTQHGYNPTGKLTAYSMQYVHPETPWNYGYSELYKYNAQGRLGTVERYILRKGTLPTQPDRALFYSDSLTYNAVGQVVGRQRYTYAVRGEKAATSPVTLTTHQYRYDDQDNLVEETVTTVPLQRNAAASTQTRRIVYEYDTKTNPYRLTDCPIFDQMSWSRNNCIRASTYLTQSGTQAKPSVDEYRYVYTNNLPVRRMQAGSASVLEQYEYESF